MPRSRVVGILWAALLLQTAAAQPARTKPSVLVLPFAPAPGLEPSDRFLGVTLQNLFENALVEIPEIQETWFLRKMWDRFDDLDQWNSFLSGKAPPLDTNGFTCVVAGEIGRTSEGYALTVKIGRRKSGPAASASLAVDFPKLVEVRRAFVHELRSAGCSPVDAPQAALWEEQLPAAAAAVLGRGVATFIASSFFSGEWRPEDLDQAARLAPGSYLAHDDLGWIKYQSSDTAAEAEFRQALALHRGIHAIDGLVHSQPDDAFAALMRERAERRGMSDAYAMGRAVLGRARVLAVPDQFAQAIAVFEKALALVRAAGDRQGEGAVLHGMGFSYAGLKQTDRAVATFEQALAVRHAAKDRAGENLTLNNLGWTYLNLGQYPKAIEYYDRKLALARGLKDRRTEAIALDSIGRAFGDMGQFDKALDSRNQELVIHRELKNLAGEADTLDNIGWVFGQMLQYEKAAASREQAIAIYHELKDRASEAASLESLGWVYERLRQFDKSISGYDQALSIYRELTNRAGEGNALNGLGTAYGNSGQYQKSTAAYTQALSIRRELKDRAAEGSALHNLGWAYWHERDYEKSVSFYLQALAVRRELKDQAGESATVFNLASAFADAGQSEKALSYYGEAVALRRELKDRKGEGEALTQQGNALVKLSRQKEAIAVFEQAVTISRELNDPGGKINALLGLGSVYDSLDRREDMLRYEEQALAAARAANDRAAEAKVLNNIGLSYTNLRQYQKSLPYYESALAAEREVKDRSQEGDTLNNLGSYYFDLDLPVKAADYYEQALTIARETKNRFNESLALGNLGRASERLHQLDKAVAFYEQALAIIRERKDRRFEGVALGNLADLYFSLKQYDKAFDYYAKALALDREAGALEGVGITLLNTGLAYKGLKEFDKSIPNFEEALAIFREVRDPYAEAQALGRLGEAHHFLKHPQLAIIYGKLSVNVFQSIRSDNRQLSAELRRSLDKSFKPYYTWLAERLIAEGRLSESLLVLDLLKQKESSEYARGGTPVSGHAVQVPLSDGELHAVTLINSSVEFTALSALPAKTPDNLLRLHVLTGELQAGNRTFRQQLDALFTGAAKPAIDPSAVKEHIGALQNMLQKLGMPAVAVYTLLGDDQISLIVITPQSASYESSAASREQVLRQIAAFQQKLRNPRSDPLPEAQALYALIFAPIRPLIEAAQAKVIYWQLNGQLRYIPIAALHDGHSYVAEQFQNVLLNVGNQTSLNEPSNPQWTGYGFGVTEGHPGFSPLPFVGDELHRIIAESASAAGSSPPLPGKIMLDSQFTREAFEQQMFDRRPVVHIASHFRFDPTDGNKSYLLLGDGSSLSVNDLADMTNLFQNVDLVTFSACETALGQQNADGQEVDALADVAIRKGAKAVLATLWPVNDRATGLFMAEFYRVRQQDKLTKSEALQRAQESMLRGEVGPQAGDATDRAALPARRDPPSQLPKGFSHPYYWAPFILIGNLK